MYQARWFCRLNLLVVAILGGPIGFAELARGGELIRREGRHIHLTTDLPSAEEAASLVASFDAAVPQWAEFWNLDNDALTGWKVDAYVIRDKAEFASRDLIPPQVPDFPFGYALGDQVFVLAQKSEYYTRHLLLHEGVHSLAFAQVGGAGPTWFREGTAELLATHVDSGQEIRVNRVPANRESVPYWGRFKRMNQLRTSRSVPTIETVMGYQPDLVGDVGAYGWSWAATMLLSTYPEYRAAFDAAAARGGDEGPGFNRDFKASLQRQWPIVTARWRVMCHDLDYGFDWSRERVALSARDPIWDGKPIELEVAPDRGWQTIAVRVPGRTRIRLTPAGKITLADTPKPWRSEPAGITFQYHRGRPLGQLLVTVLPNAADARGKTIEPLDVQSVDRPITLEIADYSWVLLRVNDGLGDLDDNKGVYRVKIEVDRR